MAAGAAMVILLVRPGRRIVAVVEFKSDAAVAAIPSDRIQGRTIAFPQDLQRPGVGRRIGPGPAGVFPLGFGRQAQIESRDRPLIFARNCLAVFPADLLDGPVRTLEAAGIVAHHRLPEGLGARRVEQPEPAADRHLVLRAFVPVADSWPYRPGSSSGEPMRNVPGSIHRIRCRTPAISNSTHSPNSSSPQSAAQAGGRPAHQKDRPAAGPTWTAHSGSGSPHQGLPAAAAGSAAGFDGRVKASREPT